MKSNFSLTKFTIITFLIFILLDVFAGKYIYKKFIRKNYKDVDRSYIITDQFFNKMKSMDGVRLPTTTHFTHFLSRPRTFST